MLCTLRLIYLEGALNSFKMPLFCISIIFISDKSHHFILCADEKQTNKK